MRDQSLHAGTVMQQDKTRSLIVDSLLRHWDNMSSLMDELSFIFFFLNILWK